jgi:hypothetical protein
LSRRRKSRVTTLEPTRDGEYTMWWRTAACNQGKILRPDLSIPLRTFVCNGW